MASNDYTFTVTTTQSHEDVFNKILNVRQWWSGFHAEEFTGESSRLNDVFTFRAGEGAHYTVQKLIEAVPGKRIVWLVTESKLDFLTKKDEWTGTRLVFDISKDGNKTKARFTHEGLVPEIECYNSCAPAWTKYMEQKLTPLLAGE